MCRQAWEQILAACSNSWTAWRGSCRRWLSIRGYLWKENQTKSSNGRNCIYADFFVCVLQLYTTIVHCYKYLHVCFWCDLPLGPGRLYFETEPVIILLLFYSFIPQKWAYDCSSSCIIPSFCILLVQNRNSDHVTWIYRLEYHAITCPEIISNWPTRVFIPRLLAPCIVYYYTVHCTAVYFCKLAYYSYSSWKMCLLYHPPK